VPSLQAQVRTSSWRAQPEPTVGTRSASLPDTIDAIVKECAKCKAFEGRVSELSAKLERRDAKLKAQNEEIASMDAVATENRETINELREALRKAKQDAKEMKRLREAAQRGRAEERAEKEVSDSRGFASMPSQLSTRGGYLSREPRFKDDTSRDDYSPTRRPQSGKSRSPSPSPSPSASAYLKRVTSAGRERPTYAAGAGLREGSSETLGWGSFMSLPSVSASGANADATRPHKRGGSDTLGWGNLLSSPSVASSSLQGATHQEHDF